MSITSIKHPDPSTIQFSAEFKQKQVDLVNQKCNSIQNNIHQYLDHQENCSNLYNSSEWQETGYSREFLFDCLNVAVPNRPYPIQSSTAATYLCEYETKIKCHPAFDSIVKLIDLDGYTSISNFKSLVFNESPDYFINRIKEIESLRIVEQVVELQQEVKECVEQIASPTVPDEIKQTVEIKKQETEQKLKDVVQKASVDSIIANKISKSEKITPEKIVSAGKKLKAAVVTNQAKTQARNIETTNEQEAKRWLNRDQKIMAARKKLDEPDVSKTQKEKIRVEVKKQDNMWVTRLTADVKSSFDVKERAIKLSTVVIKDAISCTPDIEEARARFTDWFVTPATDYLDQAASHSKVA